MIRKISLILCVSLVLSGCQSTTRTASVDPILTNNNSAEFFSKSGWQACAVGAGLGGVTCYLVTRDSLTCLVAAAASCGIAMGGNYYLDAKRSEYANKEMRLASYINDVQANTAQVKSVTDSAQIVLDKNLMTLKKLDKDIATNKVDITEAQKELRGIDANINYLNAKLIRMKTVEQDWRSVSKEEKYTGINVTKLDEQIILLNKQILVLEKQINVLTQQRSALRVV